MNDIEIVRFIDEDEFKNRLRVLFTQGYRLQNSGYDNGVWWAIFTTYNLSGF